MRFSAAATCGSLTGRGPGRGRRAAIALCLGFASPVCAQTEKSADDPTKIATKAGVAYADEFFVSGSLAIGQKFKFNARISESGLWSVGASYLFPIAILTFSAGKNEFDNGVEQTRYSLGGFAPLSELGVSTGKWQLFIPFGYTYTDGNLPVTDIDQSDGFPVGLSSNSGYVGLFFMRPLSETFTLTGGANFTKGTNDFSGVALGAGLSYHFTGDDTLGVSASYIDNSFGQDEKLRIFYRHEF